MNPVLSFCGTPLIGYYALDDADEGISFLISGIQCFRPSVCGFLIAEKAEPIGKDSDQEK